VEAEEIAGRADEEDEEAADRAAVERTSERRSATIGLPCDSGRLSGELSLDRRAATVTCGCCRGSSISQGVNTGRVGTGLKSECGAETPIPSPALSQSGQSVALRRQGQLSEIGPRGKQPELNNSAAAMVHRQAFLARSDDLSRDILIRNLAVSTR
jgi:hypothetical protein